MCRGPEINSLLSRFQAEIQAILGQRMVGMYLLGSLAIGDFRPETSDIDFVVVTDAEMEPSQFDRLKRMHAEFAADGSRWAKKVEAVYCPVAGLSRGYAGQCPQLECGTELFLAPLEDGWVFQRLTLREFGARIVGPDPRPLVGNIDTGEMRQSVQAIAGGWLDLARTDPSWLEWLAERRWQVFVIQTLCRMLYSLRTGSVTSKPAAASWGMQELGEPWTSLIRRSLAATNPEERIPQSDVEETIELIRYVMNA
ncbi:MAG: hypothetical protein K0R75_3108 [Paenibacillaceae bacterium]|jgi:hypothetical protein|nr:hypothetical protein [Paenibacillaceae bacterium]